MDDLLPPLFLRPSSLQLLVGVFFIIAASGLSYLLPSSKRKAQTVPVYGDAGDQNFHAALLEGYNKHRDSLFQIPTAHHPMTLIPTKFVDEIKDLSTSILSFENHIKSRFLGKYTGLGINDALVQSVKVDMTKNIPRIIDELQDEMGYAIDKHIGECDDWNGYPLYDMVLYLVALLSGRIFVGYPLSRDPDWLEATVRYTIDGFLGAQKLWNYPRILHPIMQYIIPEVRRIRGYVRNGSKMLGPTIRGRNSLTNSNPKSKPSDMVQWIIDNSNPEDKTKVSYIAKTEMLISVVAIHTTAMAMSQFMFDLLVHPEYIDILREEIQQVKPTDEEAWTKAKIAGLRKMDSFMKESQRLRPTGLITMNRQVEQNFKLSNGIILEKGAHIGVASGINALDAQFFQNPLEFDGLRFLKLREQPGNENKYQFVTSGPDQLHWGAGKHTCPGRFFASYEIKMLLSKILMEYDMQLPGGGSVRPPDIAIDSRLIPNPMATVQFKKRAR